MKKVVKIRYDSDSKKVYILYEEKFIDVSAIDGKEISIWAYPFIIKNKRWNGIYEEMRKLCQSEEFIIVFIGSNEDLDILKNALKDKKVELMGLNNKVVILYNSEKQSTKITVNGKAFDTSKIDNMPIEKWIFGFESDNVKWNGIFAEIVRFIGINSYSIQFVGNEKDMKTLMDNCPENVDITFKLPASKVSDNKKAKTTKKTILEKRINSESRVQESAASVRNSASQTASHADELQNRRSVSFDNAREFAGKVISGGTVEPDMSKIPIKNEFVRKNALSICSVLSIIFIFLPFVKIGEIMKLSVFDLLTSSGINIIFSILIILCPVLMIIMNYVKRLMDYRRIISISVPAFSIICEVIFFIVLKHDIPGYTIGIGMLLLIVSHILSAAVGFISYYGAEIPFKK